jgi:hypothetical protein
VRGVERVIGIQPSYTAVNVLDYLRRASTGARNLMGSGSPTLPDYARWANEHIANLGPAIKPNDLNALITTQRYWTLMGLMGFSSTPISLLVGLELTTRAVALEVAYQELEIEMLKSVNLDAAVLDTNVLMVLGDQLETYDWHKELDVRTHAPLVIWIPLAVIDELDRKKLDRNIMKLKGKSVARRTLARVALREIDRMFPDPRRGYIVERDMDPVPQRFELRILMEEPGHIRLPSVDAEVVDQAMNLSALGGRVQVVTYDTGMRLKARAAELAARQLPEPESD